MDVEISGLPGKYDILVLVGGKRLSSTVTGPQQQTVMLRIADNRTAVELRRVGISARD